MARGIFAALEEEELVIEDNSEVDQLEADVEVAEISEDQSEIDSDSDTIDNALDDVVELEQVAEVMEDSIEKEEGLDEDAAEMAQIATESICRRLGYTPRKAIIPALESFGGSSTRLEATKIALEETNLTIQKAWEAIKNFFRNIWETIKGFLARMFDANVKLANRVKAVEQSLDAAVKDGLVVKEGKDNIKVDKFAKIFNAKTVGELTKNIPVILGNHIAATKEAGVVNDKIAKIVAEGLKGAEAAAGAASGGWLGLVKGLSALTKKVYVNGITLVVDENGVVSMVDSKVTTAKGDTKVVPLASLKGVVENVADLQKIIADSKEGYEKAGTTVNNILAQMDKLSDKDNKEKVTEAIKNLKGVQKVLILANTKLPSLAIKAGNGALNYVTANIGAYGAKAAK